VVVLVVVCGGGSGSFSRVVNKVVVLRSNDKDSYMLNKRVQR